MALIAKHRSRLPKPARIAREGAAVEARLNATDRSLSPHAGGVIRSWSAPLPYEIRDDQGIGIRHPDTGSFVYYNLAGAYDSNIALILTDGESRRHNLQRLSEILRCSEVRGDDLETSIPVQYGLINWLLGVEPMLKPGTRFLTGAPCAQAVEPVAVGAEQRLLHAPLEQGGHPAGLDVNGGHDPFLEAVRLHHCRGGVEPADHG